MQQINPAVIWWLVHTIGNLFSIFKYSITSAAVIIDVWALSSQAEF